MFPLIKSSASNLYCTLVRWPFSQAFIFSPPFRELKNPWGGAGEGEKEEEREERREGEGGRIWQTPYTLYLDMFTSHAVDIWSRSSWGKNDATSDVTTSGLRPENFHSVCGGWPDFSFGQTLRLLHAEFSLTSSEVLRTLTLSQHDCHVHITLLCQFSFLGKGAK